MLKIREKLISKLLVSIMCASLVSVIMAFLEVHNVVYASEGTQT